MYPATFVGPGPSHTAYSLLELAHDFGESLRLVWEDESGHLEGCVMNREEIIARLRENEATLRKRGVAHAALFGSRARGDQGPESDTDIMIEFDPAARITIFDYANLKDYIAALFDGRVDVVNRDGLKPYVKPAATVDAIYAF
jgi:hypothetical protein